MTRLHSFGVSAFEEHLQWAIELITVTVGLKGFLGLGEVILD